MAAVTSSHHTAAAHSTNPNSVFSYRKIDDDLENSFRVNTTRRRTTASRATYLLIALTVTLGVFFAVVIHKSKSSSGDSAGERNGDPKKKLHLSEAIATVCGVTRFPEKCAAALAAYNRTVLRPDAESLLAAAMEVAAAEVAEAARLQAAVMESGGGDGRWRAAMEDCVGLLEEAERRVKESREGIRGGKKDDMMTWLSAAITDQESCLDGVDEGGGWRRGVEEELRGAVRESVICVSNSLAILKNLDSLLYPH